MHKRNVNAVFKLLMDNLQNCIFPINKDILDILI